MRIGVPKEVKTHEYRVGLVPGAVRELVHRRHEVVVEKGAEPGERVVTNGQLGVTPGGKVLVEQPRNAGSPAAATGNGAK